MSMWLALLISVVVSYLLGNINGSVLISRLHEHDDVRLHGSGNAGFTNFFRNYGGVISLLVMLVDLLKAVAACLVSGFLLKPFGLYMEGQMLGGIGVTLGHNFPALLGFRGGKGIVCSLAVAIVLDWRIAVIIVGVFLILYFATHYVSLGSIVAAISYTACFVLMHKNRPWVAAGGAFLGLLALYMHRANIVRLFQGKESKVNFFGRKQP